MARKWKIICVICIIVCVIFSNLPQKPRLISSITSFDTTYLTILIDKRETENIKKLEEKIIKMCREDLFDNMKLQTEEKPLAKRLHISVYTSKTNLEKGTPFLIIKNDAGN